MSEISDESHKNNMNFIKACLAYEQVLKLEPDPLEARAWAKRKVTELLAAALKGVE